MKTNLLMLAVAGMAALALSSCAPEHRPTDNNCQFIIKKIDGKRKWALAEKTQGCERLYTEFEYDSIFSAETAPYRIKQLFIGLKDGKYYAITSWGKTLFDGAGFSSLTSIYQRPENCASIYGPLFNEAKVSNGFLFFYLPRGIVKLFEFGPAEYLFGGYYSLIYKKNGKWGALHENDRSEIAPCIYDGIIEVTGHYHYYLVKNGGKWSALDDKGRVLQKSQSVINYLLKLPILSSKEYHAGEKSLIYRRIGSGNVGQIAVSPWESEYITF